jgi:hypothetical protein
MPQNLFKIYDGRNYFWQWDSGQKLIVLDDTVDEIHFSHKDMKHAIPKDVLTDKDGLRVCPIPDALLTLPKNLIATAYVTDNNANKTLRSVIFGVKKRPIPSDYVVNGDFYIEDFENRIDIIEEVIENDVNKFTELQREIELRVKTINGVSPDLDGNLVTDSSLVFKDGALSVNTTNQMEQDNTLPITSAGVYATVGNIEALLKTI